MWLRWNVGFWLFCFFDFAVGFVFIFILQDVWYHHVLPHVTYALVFVPFYSDFRDRPVGESLADRALGLVARFPWIARLIEAMPPVRRLINRLVIDGVTSSTPARPHPFSLWTPGATPVKSDDPKSYGPSLVWPGLVDRAFTGRHLGGLTEAEVDALPPEDEVVKLFQRDVMDATPRTTALFCFFAQWFTDSFLRTHPDDRRKNTSNHEIDLCQIYGLGEETTRMLRTGYGGKLKSRLVEGAEFPDTLADPVTLAVKPEFAGISYDPIHATSFGEPDPPHGTAANLRKLLAGIGPWTVTDERWRVTYAAGLERANSTLLYSCINTIFLREHNRLADVLRGTPEAQRGNWGDDQLFETARNINIVLLLKVIIEDYINHLASSPIRLSLEQGFADARRWYRTNRISLEFNLLYRWHSMTPDVFVIDSKVLTNEAFRFNNVLVEELGVEKILDEASRQPAGRLGLHNTPSFLMGADRSTLRFARQFRLRGFNDYRERWNMPRYESIEELTGGDPVLTAELTRLYPDIPGDRDRLTVKGVDRIELPVGLLAERRARAVLPPLLMRMVASDAFSQALTNPLLAAYVFGPQCFTTAGLDEIHRTRSFADIVQRNLAPGAMKPFVSFTRAGA
jgi:prostaglandin-endoperoxide synthase 2